MSMIGFPLLLIPFAIYNIFVFLMPSVAFTSPIASVTLMSQTTWTATFGDALLALGMFLLLFEVIKAARPGARYLTDHLLSLVVFGAAVAEFLLLAPFGTSTFFLLTVLTGVEFLAGVSIGFRNRRRHAPAAVPVDVAPAAPAPTVPTPSHERPSESFSDLKSPELRQVEPVFAPSEPLPQHVQMPHAEAPSKPAPPLAEARPPESAPVVTERKIADWNVADLVSDDPSPSQATTKPPGSPDTPPKS